MRSALPNSRVAKFRTSESASATGLPSAERSEMVTLEVEAENKNKISSLTRRLKWQIRVASKVFEGRAESYRVFIDL